MDVGAAQVLGRFQAISQDSSLPRIDASMENSKLREVAKEFESIFIKQLLDTMKNTLNKENRLVDGGMAENVFEDMLYTEYSRLMSKSGNFGIAEMIVQQYSRDTTELSAVQDTGMIAQAAGQITRTDQAARAYRSNS